MDLNKGHSIPPQTSLSNLFSLVKVLASVVERAQPPLMSQPVHLHWYFRPSTERTRLAIHGLLPAVRHPEQILCEVLAGVWERWILCAVRSAFWAQWALLPSFCSIHILAVYASSISSFSLLENPLSYDFWMMTLINFSNFWKFYSWRNGLPSKKWTDSRDFWEIGMKVGSLSRNFANHSVTFMDLVV